MSNNSIPSFPKVENPEEITTPFNSGDIVESSKINSVFYTLSMEAQAFLDGLAIATSNSNTYQLTDDELSIKIANDLKAIKVNNATYADSVNLETENETGTETQPNYIDSNGNFKKSSYSFIYGNPITDSFIIPTGFHFGDIYLKSGNYSMALSANQINYALKSGTTTTSYYYYLPNMSGTLATKDEMNTLIENAYSQYYIQTVTLTASNGSYANGTVTFENISKDDYSFCAITDYTGTASSTNDRGFGFVAITSITQSGDDVKVSVRLYNLSNTTSSTTTCVINVMAVQKK